jgi:hypothetical protein
MLNSTYQDLVLHEVPRRTIEHDIRLFLEHQLGTVREECVLAPLVKLAVPLFIYIVTVCRYIGTNMSNPTAYSNKDVNFRRCVEYFKSLCHGLESLLP